LLIRLQAGFSRSMAILLTAAVGICQLAATCHLIRQVIDLFTDLLTDLLTALLTDLLNDLLTNLLTNLLTDLLRAAVGLCQLMAICHLIR
jgi:hypothetical protein